MLSNPLKMLIQQNSKGAICIVIYQLISIVCLLIAIFLAFISIYQWFKNHIFQIIQDLTGNTRVKQVQYLRNNSFLLNTRSYNQKMNSLNQLVERYLQHDKVEADTPPDLILPTDLNAGLRDWISYPIGDKVHRAVLEVEESAITEVLSDYDILGKNGEPIGIFQNKQCPYQKVILPKSKNVSFTVVKSCVVVHWRAYNLEFGVDNKRK